MYFAFPYRTCSFACCSIDVGPEIISLVCFSIIYIHTIICLDLLGFVLQLGPLDAYIVSDSNFLLSGGSPITLLIIFSMFDSSIPGISSSTGPFHGTKRICIWHPYSCILILLKTLLLLHTWLIYVLVWLNCSLWCARPLLLISGIQF